jgi:hypothetical protein
MGQKSKKTLPLWSACAPKSMRARDPGMSQGTDRPVRDGLGPKCKRWHPERVAAVPFLRNGEGKKSPLRRLPTDHRESLTQTCITTVDTGAISRLNTPPITHGGQRRDDANLLVPRRWRT